MAHVLGRDLDEFLELDVDEAAMLVLAWCRRPGVTPNRWGIVNEIRNRLGEQGADSSSAEVNLRVVEGWQWLRNEGFLAPSNEQSSDTWEVVTRAGRRVEIEGHIAETRAAGLLRTAAIDPALRSQVLPMFRRGQYVAAVVTAFREVEIRVRSYGGFPAEAIGVKLMRDAFKIDGPLDDPELPVAEREARQALFAGAIGTYKNPGSHRNVNMEDAQEASEAVLFADALLRIADRARVAVKDE